MVGVRGLANKPPCEGASPLTQTIHEIAACVGTYFPRTPSCLLIRYCCAIDRMLFVSQYSTRSAGKKKNITEKISGMIHIIFACTGSGGVGFRQVCSRLVPVISRGRM